MSPRLRRGLLPTAAIGEPVVGAGAGGELTTFTLERLGRPVAEPFAPEDVHATAVP